jgi:integrase/recombinase XerD
VARGAALFDRKGNRKYLNGSERTAYFRAANDEPDVAWRAFFLTLFYTGCRISEGLNLTPERVDMAGKALVFETLKRRRRGHFRSVPIPDSLTALFGQVLAGPESPVRIWNFSRTTAYRLVKEKMGTAGITGGMACPKGLRHGFAVACIAHDVPLTTVQKWLGHARLETTAIYLNVTGDDERRFAKRLWSAG